MSERTPNLSQLLDRREAKLSARLRVSMPAQVLSYDADTQRVNVQPMLKEIVDPEIGEPFEEALPVINNVPVVFPGGGGFRITFPIAAGDFVFLIFADRTLDGWKQGGGFTSSEDRRRHHFSDPVAIPGILNANGAHWSTEAGVVTLGSDSGAADFVALAAKVDAALTLLKTHQHLSFGTPSAELTTMGTSTGSATVKIKG